MKKLLILMTALLLMLCASAAAESMACVPNPWMSVTAEMIEAQIGFRFIEPAGAENVRYCINLYEGKEEPLAEMQFTSGDVRYVARTRCAEGFTDVSGCYYGWDTEADCEVDGCSGVLSRVKLYNGDVARVLWYDSESGMMHSLSAEGEAVDADGLPALAASVCGPVSVSALERAGEPYEGTTGASLKEAAAACALAEYAWNWWDGSGAEAAIADDVSALEPAVREGLRQNLAGLNCLLETAFEDYESVRGLFDDAGAGETMEALAQHGHVREAWQSLYALLLHHLADGGAE